MKGFRLLRTWNKNFYCEFSKTINGHFERHDTRIPAQLLNVFVNPNASAVIFFLVNPEDFNGEEGLCGTSFESLVSGLQQTKYWQKAVTKFEIFKFFLRLFAI